ncbi:hypothetical protein [Microlunatus soli]|uniref:DUF2867 domain-containing protein n=1 Tax=Microlunatus soli TaxID=630515 RepID=A0A1H1PNY1_9ACTN|nr:hypothetical protein [Microlunatus soli]SDS12848.1 hypothetical protein SAMN04489812_0968 [Microlunatus soli]
MSVSETTTAVDAAVGVDAMPADLLAIATLPSLDYANLVSTPTDLAVAPEIWARTMVGDVPNTIERVVWNGILRLGLSREPSPERVAGWRITGRDPQWIRLEASSGLLAANIIVRTVDGRVSMATLIRYRSAVTRPIWTVLTPLHTSVMPKMLAAAIEQLAGDDGGTNRS